MWGMVLLRRNNSVTFSCHLRLKRCARRSIPPSDSGLGENTTIVLQDEKAPEEVCTWKQRPKFRSFEDLLSSRGVSRRDFMKLCGAIAVAAGLGELAAPRVAQALENSVIGATRGNLYPVIWIEGASCTGCTESFAQVESPDRASVVLELISLNYSETLSAAAGHSMEEAKAQTIEAGDYILIYEGAVLEGWNGQALRVADMPGTAHLEEAAANATAVVALGSCAVNGGWMGSSSQHVAAHSACRQYLKEGRHRRAGCEYPRLPGEPRVARVGARGCCRCSRTALPDLERREQAGRHLRSDDPRQL